MNGTPKKITTLARQALEHMQTSTVVFDKDAQESVLQQAKGEIKETTTPTSTTYKVTEKEGKEKMKPKQKKDDPTKAAPSKSKKGKPGYCDACDKFCEKILRCEGCKAAHYCGRECQKADWKAHKKECKKMQQTTAGKNI
eukprot:TRINITY_DN18822_c0_g1_i1.p1 TRINITY_DN18822_c0_g1~~TRINITY_DN18822_c0_g1_i1.p1  ORF type:complete len:140 (+),score=31.84 TRINITY_DN18822_c0_g1_i1:274-693(+)